MKIGIITFHFVNNYGGVLQAYALHEFIKKSFPVECNIYDNWLTNPFNMKRNMVNSLSIWCGFSPQYDDSGRFASMQEVQEMPCYPDDGSIRIIDNTVVVKM